MLFQMHVKLPDEFMMFDVQSGIEIVLESLSADPAARSGSIEDTWSSAGPMVGFWSITDANEDPRIARVRAIAENLRDGSVDRDDIARALLRAIDEPLQKVDEDAKPA